MGGLVLLAARLAMELRQWSDRLPQLIDRFPALWNGIEDPPPPPQPEQDGDCLL